MKPIEDMANKRGAEMRDTCISKGMKASQIECLAKVTARAEMQEYLKK